MQPRGRPASEDKEVQTSSPLSFLRLALIENSISGELESFLDDPLLKPAHWSQA